MGLEVLKIKDSWIFFVVATQYSRRAAGALNGYIKSTEDAGELIAKLALDTKKHNGQMIQFDGKIVTDYEAQMH